jgi:iron(II)-dependent oxidoreductase
MESSQLKSDIAERLADARARTLLLVASVTEDDLRRQHDALMGPILWDLGHIAHFEELWLLDNLRGEIRFGEMPGMFNPFENPRSARGSLELPDWNTTLCVLAEVRARVLRVLESADLSDRGPRLLRHGFVYNMVLQHEYQHNETMLQTLQLKQGAPYAAPRAYAFAPPALAFETGAMVRFPGGEVQLGTDDESVAYDNERPLHTVRLDPFHIDVTAMIAMENAVRSGSDQYNSPVSGFRLLSPSPLKISSCLTPPASINVGGL